MKNRIIPVIVGPTAVGKTKYAVQIARKLNGRSYPPIPCRSIDLWISEARNLRKKNRPLRSIIWWTQWIPENLSA